MKPMDSLISNKYVTKVDSIPFSISINNPFPPSPTNKFIDSQGVKIPLFIKTHISGLRELLDLLIALGLPALSRCAHTVGSAGAIEGGSDAGQHFSGWGGEAGTATFSGKR